MEVLEVGALKLFAWQPQGHGELSFFVMAETLATAELAVEALIASLRHDPFVAASADGWGTDYYTLTIADEAQVLTNENG